MNTISDNISELRRQINLLYGLIGKANLYISRMDGSKVNAVRLKSEMGVMHELLGFIEDELNSMIQKS